MLPVQWTDSEWRSESGAVGLHSIFSGTGHLAKYIRPIRDCSGVERGTSNKNIDDECYPYNYCIYLFISGYSSLLYVKLYMCVYVVLIYICDDLKYILVYIGLKYLFGLKYFTISIRKCNCWNFRL